MNKTYAPLLVIVTLALSGLACTAAANFFSTGSGDGTGPGTPPPSLPEVATSAGPAEATQPAGQRRELPPTPTAAQAVAADDPRASLDLAKPYYVDYFDDPKRWFDYDTPGRAAYGVKDGHLWGIDYEPEDIYSWWSYTDKQSDLVYAEVSATNGDCVGLDNVGFVIHSSPETAAGGYGLEVSCDGQWRLVRHRQGKAPTVMVDWTASDAIQQGKDATNRLGIWDQRGKFYLFINGQMVGEASDPAQTYPGGTFALYVRALQTYNLGATFDDLAFWELPYK